MQLGKDFDQMVLPLLSSVLQLHDVESQLKVLKNSDTASKAKVASLQEELDERIEDTNSLRTALQVCVRMYMCVRERVYIVCVCSIVNANYFLPHSVRMRRVLSVRKSCRC